MIYQLYYNEQTKAKCSPLTEHVNTSQVVTDLFESYWLTRLQFDDGYNAVLSPEFERKTGKPMHLVMNRLARANADIFIMRNTRIINYPYIFDAERWHKGFIELAANAYNAAGLKDYLFGPSYTLYCNYWFMRGKFVRLYQQELKTLIAAMNDPKFSRPCSHNTSSGHTRQQLLKATGFPHYTFRPFICERLIGMFIVKHKLKVQFI